MSHTSMSELEEREGRILMRQLLGGNVRAYTLRELAERRPRGKTSHGQSFDSTNGCVWHTDCEDCRWSNCIVPGGMTPKAYFTNDGRLLRMGIGAIELRRGGLSEKDVAKHYGVHPRTLRGAIAAILGPARSGTHRELSGRPALETLARNVSYGKLNKRR